MASFMQAVTARIMQMTRVLTSVGFDRREPAQPVQPEVRQSELPPEPRLHFDHQTEIPPEQMPGGGAPHR